MQFDSNDMIIAMFIHTNLPIAMFYFYAFVTTLPSGGSIFGFGIIVCSVLNANPLLFANAHKVVSFVAPLSDVMICMSLNSLSHTLLS